MLPAPPHDCQAPAVTTLPAAAAVVAAASGAFVGVLLVTGADDDDSAQCQYHSLTRVQAALAPQQ